jgi:hypothetical protein
MGSGGASAGRGGQSECGRQVSECAWHETWAGSRHGSPRAGSLGGSLTTIAGAHTRWCTSAEAAGSAVHSIVDSGGGEGGTLDSLSSPLSPSGQGLRELDRRKSNSLSTLFSADTGWLADAGPFGVGVDVGVRRRRSTLTSSWVVVGREVCRSISRGRAGGLSQTGSCSPPGSAY